MPLALNDIRIILTSLSLSILSMTFWRSFWLIEPWLYRLLSGRPHDREGTTYIART